MTATKTVAPIVPAVMDKYEEGAILEYSYGYEQTNYAFYVITKRSKGFCTLQPMKKKTSGMSSGMTNYAEPDGIDESKRPIRKKLKIRDGKELGFTGVKEYCAGWCNLWDGKQKQQSHYA